MSSSILDTRGVGRVALARTFESTLEGGPFRVGRGLDLTLGSGR